MNSSLFDEAQKLRNNSSILEAVTLYKKAHLEFLKHGDLTSAAECLHMIGVAFYQDEQFSKADSALQSSLESFEKLHDDEHIGFVLRDRGLVALKQNDLHHAELLIKASIGKLHETGDRGHEGISYVKLGKVYQERGLKGAAMSAMLKGIELLKEGSDKFFLSSAYFDYAKLLYKSGDRAKAKQYAQCSLDILNSFANKFEFLERRKNIQNFFHEIKD